MLIAEIAFAVAWRMSARRAKPRNGGKNVAPATYVGSSSWLDTARYAYVYVVALHDTGSVDQATSVLTASLARHPFDRDTLFLSAYALDRGRLGEARKLAARLSALDPDAADVRALLEQMRSVPAR